MPDDTSAPFFEALQAVLRRLAGPEQLLRTILDQAIAQTGADRGVFVEVSRDGRLDYRVFHRYERSELSGEAGRFSRTLLADVLHRKEGIIVDNALDDPHYKHQESVQDLRLVSALCMPIRIGGEIGALVHLERNKPGHFQRHHLDLLESLLRVAGPALDALRAGGEILSERDRLLASETRTREELEETRELLARDWSFGRFVGRSPAVRALERTVLKAAGAEFPVLIQGESGTGKSLIARILHHGGARAKGAFVTVFCPSLEKGLVESELFGHARGAYTGAITDRIGKVPLAEGGTLFLDEIGDLPAEIQPKLLRLLQEKTFERLGDPRERRADVRVIAATSRDLQAQVRAGGFRSDLYHRLDFLRIRVPPLRERREDIPLLLRHILQRSDSGRWADISNEAMDELIRLDFLWPGNVRHLEQLAARISLEPAATPLGPAEVARLLGDAVAPAEGPAPAAAEVSLPDYLEAAEKSFLAETLTRNPDLTRAQIAEKLGIGEATLFKKLKRYGLKDA